MSFGTHRPKGLPPELRDVEPFIVVFSERACSNKVWPILCHPYRILLGRSVKDCERLTRVVSVDGVDLPTLGDLTDQAIRGLGKRQFIVCGKFYAMFDHVIARTVITTKIIQHLCAADACSTGSSDIG